MLDSLVRVSRRVGWRTDRFATDPQRLVLPSRSTHAVGENCKQCFPSRTQAERRGQVRRGKSSVSEQSTWPGYNTSSEEEVTFPTGL